MLNREDFTIQRVEPYGSFVLCYQGEQVPFQCETAIISEPNNFQRFVVSFEMIPPEGSSIGCLEVRDY